MRAGYVPVNISDAPGQGEQDLENPTQPSQQEAPAPQTSFVSSSETKIGPNGESIYSAVAIPDTIRPPNLSKNKVNEDPISVRSFSKRVCILIMGVVLSLMTFWECIELFFANCIMLGFCFLGATAGLLIGTFVGVFRGQWRVLVPGLILQHVVFTLSSFFPYKQE